jgi:hypothetical protein
MFVAAPAVARTATVDELIGGAQSCAAVTTTAGVDVRALESAGWGKGTMSAQGKPVATTLQIYGKGPLVLMFDTAQAKPICIITARISSIADFVKIRAAFQAKYGTPVKDDGKGEQIFIAPDHRIVDLASTGSNDRPSVRVGVGPVIQESK